MQKVKLKRKEILTIQLNAETLQYCPKLSFEDMLNLKRTAKSLFPVVEFYNEANSELFKRFYKEEKDKDGIMQSIPIASKEAERKQAFKDLLEQEEEVELHYIRLSKIKPLLEDAESMGNTSGGAKAPFSEYAINLIDLLFLEDDEYEKVVNPKKK